MKKWEAIQHFNTPISPIKPKDHNKIGGLRNLRKNTGALLEYLWELSGSIRFYKVDAAIVVGEEKHTGQPITTLYIGHYDNYEYILNEIYAAYKVVKKHRKINSLYAEKWINRYEKSVDLLFLDIELLFCKMLLKRNFLQIPQWVRQKFEVPETWEGVLSKFRKNTKKTDLRKMRKYNFACRLTKAEADFKDFYHRMYIPYLRKRFGNAVIIEPEWKVMRQCRKGELMQILRDNSVVASVLLHNLAGRLAYVWVGIPDNIDEEMSKGAFSALYYFTIRFGYEHGCSEIDFLGSRPLLTDGLFRYKRKWGTYVQDSPVPRGDILLRPLRFNAPLQKFFAHHFFITREGKDIAGKIFLDEHKMAKKDIKHIMEYYFTNGLKRLKIYSLFGFDDDAVEWSHSRASEVKLIDLSQSSNPAETFCHV